jgi:hypothetical protein
MSRWGIAKTEGGGRWADGYAILRAVLLWLGYHSVHIQECRPHENAALLDCSV